VGWAGRYEVVFAEPSDDACRADLEPAAWLDEAARRWGGEIDGVFSSSDYPGATLAAALAGRLGLPGPPAATVLRCSHKYESRRAQRAAVPEATAAFWAIDARHPEARPPPDLPFPCFVKPVKGAFSVLAQKVGSPVELRRFLDRPPVREFVDDYLAIFHRLLALLTDFELDGGWFLAEELLHGEQATVEGWSAGGGVEILGVVDSVLHPATGSFLRFDYPSSLPAAVTRRMEDVARRVMGHLGLTSSLFNIEMIWDPETDRLAILEINPRLCGQFADLYARVDGTNGYEVALALATGGTPHPLRRAGRSAVASSLPLRVFEPVRVVAAPGAEDLAAAEALCPGTLVWNEVAAGEELCDFQRFEDGQSHRYGVINLGGSDREALLGQARRVLDRLGYRFEPLAPPRRRDYG
jgi:hypothetical protein